VRTSRRPVHGGADPARGREPIPRPLLERAVPPESNSPLRSGGAPAPRDLRPPRRGRRRRPRAPARRDLHPSCSPSRVDRHDAHRLHHHRPRVLPAGPYQGLRDLHHRDPRHHDRPHRDSGGHGRSFRHVRCRNGAGGSDRGARRGARAAARFGRAPRGGGRLPRGRGPDDGTGRVGRAGRGPGGGRRDPRAGERHLDRRGPALDPPAPHDPAGGEPGGADPPPGRRGRSGAGCAPGRGLAAGGAGGGRGGRRGPARRVRRRVRGRLLPLRGAPDLWRAGPPVGHGGEDRSDRRGHPEFGTPLAAHAGEGGGGGGGRDSPSS
jgi:hypothetical protein